MAQKSTAPSTRIHPATAHGTSPFDLCTHTDHDLFHTVIDAQATLGTLRRNRLGETGQTSLTAALVAPADRLTLYAGANMNLNTDMHWQEPQALAGLKLQIPLGQRIGLRNETEGRHNLSPLPLGSVTHQNYLTTKTALVVKASSATTVEAAYTFKFSNDYIPDGETNYAQVDSYGMPRLVHTEVITLTAKHRIGDWTIKGNVQTEPNLQTPTSPDTGLDWLGAGLGAEWSPGAHQAQPNTPPLQIRADIQYTHAPGLRGQPGVAARLSATYSF